VWFFLLWCYDIFNIFPVWLSCDPAKHQTHLIKYVQGQWLPSNQ
jgi:hypothetical protein